MVLYIFDNILSFAIGILFVISTFLLGFRILFQAIKTHEFGQDTTYVFGFSLLFFGFAHGVWTHRAAFIPKHPSLFVIFPYWQGFWILFMLGVTLIGIWNVLLSYPGWLQTRKWSLIILFFPWLIVTLDVLLFANPAMAEWVCSGLISDIRPDILVIFVVGLSLTFFIGLGLDFFYQQFKRQEHRLVSFLTLFGLLLVLIGGLFETRVIPICQVITVGRILMLIGLWVIFYGIVRLPPMDISNKVEV